MRSINKIIKSISSPRHFNILKLFKYFVLIICFVPIINSCMNPYKLKLNRYVPNVYPIEVQIISDEYWRVDQVAENSLMLDTNGKAALRVLEMTHYIADMSVDLKTGTGVRFVIRDVKNKYSKAKTIWMDVTNQNCKIYNNEKEIFSSSDYKLVTNSQSRIKIENDGKYLRVYFDCDKIFEFETYLINTEYLIVESLENSQVKLQAIQFEMPYEIQ